MATHRLLAHSVLATIFLTLTSLAGADAFLGSCTGTPLDFKNAKAACASGEFPGQTVVSCSDSGQFRKARLCNSDGARKGVYLNNCSGLATGFKSVNAACANGGLEGQLLVQCDRGEESKRRMCEPAVGETPKTQIFLERCGNGAPLAQRNLKNACQVNGGSTLVKCRRRSSSWVAEESMACDGRRDRLTIKNCSYSERDTLIADYRWAELRVDRELENLEGLFRTNYTMSDTTRNRMETVRRNLEKLRNHMDRKRTFYCRSNRNRCGGPVTAHAIVFPNRIIRGNPPEARFCSNYFSQPAISVRGSIIVHEISHYLLETNDNGTEHGGCTAPVLAPTDSNYHRQAEYYEHIVECGLYVP